MKSNRLRSLEIMLNDWAEWVIGHPGYSGVSPIIGIGEGTATGEFKDRQPGKMPPSYILGIDRAIRRVGDDEPVYRDIIETEYLSDAWKYQKMVRFCANRAICISEYEKTLDAAKILFGEKYGKYGETRRPCFDCQGG